MNQPTLKDLAELAGMTEKQIRHLNSSLFASQMDLDWNKADELLALALIKARRDRMREACSIEARCEIETPMCSTITAVEKKPQKKRKQKGTK